MGMKRNFAQMRLITELLKYSKNYFTRKEIVLKCVKNYNITQEKSVGKSCLTAVNSALPFRILYVISHDSFYMPEKSVVENSQW